MSRPSRELFLMSRPRTLPSLIARVPIDPVATPYETPPRETKRATSATTIAGDVPRMLPRIGPPPSYAGLHPYVPGARGVGQLGRARAHAVVAAPGAGP